MRRREFIALLGRAAAWSSAARAEQSGPVPQVGVLMGLPQSDSEGQARFQALRDGLRKLGWVDGRNVQLITRWAGSAKQLTTDAAELVAMKPNVIFAAANPAMIALRRQTTIIPIVFAQVSDPVRQGVVESLARPGGNMTGFIGFENGLASKWIELLKQVAPAVKTLVVMYDPANPSWHGFMNALSSAAKSLGVQLAPAPISSEADVEQALEQKAGKSDFGLAILPAPSTTRFREQITRVAARTHIPGIYPFRYFVDAGGLIEYGVDNLELYREAAGYIDRILKGEAPATLPVQSPTKFQLIINLKTAKSLGLTVPQSLLVEADEVIE